MTPAEQSAGLVERLTFRDRVAVVGGKFKGRNATVHEHRVLLLANIEGVGPRWIKATNAQRIKATTPTADEGGENV
jgi:hypothetical protein